AAQFVRSVDPESDAQAYLVMLKLARDLNVPRLQIDTIFFRARARFPTYFSYYSEYATMLLTKWFGRPGEITDFVQSLRPKPDDDDGAIAYARVADWLAWELSSADIYRDTGLVWEDVHRGFNLVEARDGLDKHGWTTLLYYAAVARDRPAARKAF